MTDEHKQSISAALRGHKTSEEARKKIGDANRRQVYFICDYCGSRGSDRPSHYKRKRRHFCKQECYNKFREERLPKEEHNNWKGGITKENQRGRGNRRYKKWQQSVLERDNHACVWCGNKQNLQADHIKRWVDYKELRYETSNGRTLCMKCHDKTRTRFFYENPELLK